MTSRESIDRELAIVLKRFDRIGFGRYGAPDAEQSILDWNQRLDEDGRAALRDAVVSLLDHDAAEVAAGELHYNTPEMIQALALALCGSLPIPAALPHLLTLRRTRAFDDALRKEALEGALHLLLPEG